MENLLTAHPDLKAVFATNDQMALGAVEAIAAHNLTGKVQVVGFDATREAVRAVVAGRLSGDMAGLPEVMGRKAVEEAIQAAKGQPVDRQAIITPVLVTKENASQFLQ
jgi:ABC-type sugar transport system substrate-binding protein